MNQPSLEKDESAYEERVLRLEQNEWTEDPGATSDALEPAAEQLLKTLPERNESVYEGELPPLQNQITRVTRGYLQVSSGVAVDRWMVVFAMSTAVPGSIAFCIFGIWSLTLIDSRTDFYLPILLAVLAPTLSWLSVRPFIHLFFFAYEDEPLRFCRESGKVYRFRVTKTRILGMDVPARAKAEIVVYDWSSIRAEITRHIMFSGATARRDSFLQLAIVDPATGQVKERFRIGDRDTHGGFIDRLLLWESIRRYMEEGPERVAPASLKLHRNNLLDCFEEFNPFSLPGNMAPGGQRFFGYLMAATLWTMSVLLMYTALCRWVAGRTGRKVDWGELEQTVFRDRADDPAAKNTLDPSIEAPKMWAKETRRRKRALMAWFASMSLQWFFVAYLSHAWPYCDCSPEARFCIEMESLCPRWNYGDPAPAMPAAEPPPMDARPMPREGEPVR